LQFHEFSWIDARMLQTIGDSGFKRPRRRITSGVSIRQERIAALR
jgi:hypothetical protein